MKNKKGFTLVELIVVITILVILATIWFIYFSWNVSEANKTKLTTNLISINKLLSTELSSWKDISNYLTGNLIIKNWVNRSLTIGSWTYILWNLDYKVWKLNFYKIKTKWDDFKVKTNSWNLNYIFATLKFPGKVYHQIAWQFKNESWLNEVVIYWKFYSNWPDTKWLISEKGFDIWLENWETLTWSLY